MQCVPGRPCVREGRMARPWRKKWPYVGKSGRRSYVVGFYDHDRVERCRTFPSVRHARAWMDDYITAERRGRDSLRRFCSTSMRRKPTRLRRARSARCLSSI